MALQKPRPLEALEQVVSAFKQFEKKLDKLQGDVNYHGQTLSDLRTMVANITAPADRESNLEVPKRPSRKTTAIQYECVEPSRVKRKTVIQPLVSKIKAKSFQGPKHGLRSLIEAPFSNTRLSSPKVTKHSQRPLKADAPRKATTLRSQKANKRSKSKK